MPLTHPDLITLATMHAAADESQLARDVRLLVAELRVTRGELRAARDGLRECEQVMADWAGLVEARDREVKRLQGIVDGLAERVAAQSELLGRKAEAN